MKQFKGDLDGALSDLLQSDGLSSYRFQHDDAHLRIWVVRVKKGNLAEANRELFAYLATRSDGKPEDWTARLGEFLLGNMTEPDLFAAATSSDKVRNRALQCAAWYYSGLKQLLAGNKTLAAENFAKCLAMRWNRRLITNMCVPRSRRKPWAWRKRGGSEGQTVRRLNA